jgi:PII-like signaling protein
MRLEGEGKLLRIFIGESDKWHGKPLYQAIVEHLRSERIAGATVVRAIEGYGARSHVHTSRILRLSEDLPLIIEVVDTEENIRRVLPVLDEMVPDGLVTLEKVEMITYRAGTPPEQCERSSGYRTEERSGGGFSLVRGRTARPVAVVTVALRLVMPARVKVRRGSTLVTEPTPLSDSGPSTSWKRTSSRGHPSGLRRRVAQRVAQRVAELEDAIAERHERLAQLARDSATEAPTLADVAPLLHRLPILATSLDTAPQGELRAFFDALQLDVVYQPADSALDVAVTLYDRGSDTGDLAPKVRAEDVLAPPAGSQADGKPRPHRITLLGCGPGSSPDPAEASAGSVRSGMAIVIGHARRNRAQDSG